jgi:hypothetical protein
MRAMALLFLLSGIGGSSRQGARPAAADARASYLVTVADDFVVDVYLNGEPVPDSRRQLLMERFGATAERIDVKVKKGDWLVFNVVNNRLRWKGQKYFAVAGCFAKGEFGFVSSVEDGAWSCCDDPADVADFIADPIFGAHRRVQKVGAEWGEGTPLMRSLAGDGWKGTPVWGGARNTWIKVLLP